MVKNISKWSFLEPLLYQKESKHLAEISRELNKPHATVRKYLNEFEKQGLVTKQIKGRMTMYKLQLKNPSIIVYLTWIEKERLAKVIHKDLLMKEIVYFLGEASGKILIFGSSVEGTKKANDIDVILEGKISSKSVKEFEKKFGVKFHIINLKSLSDISETLKEEIINKHLIVQNSEEIIKWMLKN
ncbi:helix-turn-helix transcriptional regulator [Candidatus Pacearchaeota archaeon]|nr:helix-turn-helix transcriptional regulator [Candidatus Pacearchaeota archaeon]